MAYHGIVPYLFYDDAEAALQWYARMFGFEEIGRWPDERGRIQNAEMRAGSTEIWLDGGGRQFFGRDGQARPMWIGMWVDDVDATYRQMTAAGLPVSSPETRSFGVRMLTVDDPFGYSWGFMRRV